MGGEEQPFREGETICFESAAVTEGLSALVGRLWSKIEGVAECRVRLEEHFSKEEMKEQMQRYLRSFLGSPGAERYWEERLRMGAALYHYGIRPIGWIVAFQWLQETLEESQDPPWWRGAAAEAEFWRTLLARCAREQSTLWNGYVLAECTAFLHAMGKRLAEVSKNTALSAGSLWRNVGASRDELDQALRLMDLMEPMLQNTEVQSGDEEAVGRAAQLGATARNIRLSLDLLREIGNDLQALSHRANVLALTSADGLVRGSP